MSKTTPDAARSVLGGQPHVAYALIALMVKMNAVDVGVLQQTVATFSAPSAPLSAPTPAPGPSVSAVPPHLAAPPPNQYRTPPPHQSQPPHPQPYPHQVPNQRPPPLSNYGYNHAQNQGYAGSLPAGSPGQGGPAGMQGGLPAPFAALPEDQKAMIMRVIQMTPEQIAAMPPQERAGIVQLVFS
ncbi:hypothetical protein HWV62_33895 [Athelia sp. TMB]|nr:hypothetical protein HWV62_33895 [Athelia sp. TMB]